MYIRVIPENPWLEFPFRPGDIVISAPAKSGTTWVQMICALLIFQTPALPAPIPKLSPWLDSKWPQERDMSAVELAAQQHRRFMKTHKSLNELPSDPRVNYIAVARNPLDVAVSQYYQRSLLSAEHNSEQQDGVRNSDEPARRYVLDNISRMGSTRNGHDNYFDKMLKKLSCAWGRRADPNVVLMHYQDMVEDLAAEMRRLAERLDITVAADKWSVLVQAATFEQMQAAADQLQPLKYAEARDTSKEHAAFFRRGSSGDGRALLTEVEVAGYYTRAARVAPRELLEWLHRDDDSFG